MSYDRWMGENVSRQAGLSLFEVAPRRPVARGLAQTRLALPSRSERFIQGDMSATNTWRNVGSNDVASRSATCALLTHGATSTCLRSLLQIAPQRKTAMSTSSESS